MPDLPKGEWGSVQLEVPDLLKDVREGINSVAEILITFLDIATAALGLIRAFASAFLDPLAALLAQILNLINQILNDFRQVGIYLTGDYALMEYPYGDLEGGYTEYERRMVGRLTNRADPTRPNISPLTTVYALFTYISEDISNIERLIKQIKQLMAFFDFRVNPKGSLPIPSITKVEYGAETTGVFGGLGNLATWDASPPNKAKVLWKTPQTSAKRLGDPPSAFAGPGGYVVTVSTLRDGIPLRYDRPQADAGMEEGVSGDLQQPREYGSVLDYNGRPVTLYGGAEMLVLKGQQGWNVNTGFGGKPKNGKSRVFGLQNPARNTVIPLEELKDGDTYFFQRTFYVPQDTALQWITQESSFVLDLEEMPNDARVVELNGEMTLEDLGKASTYYVRVASTTSELVEAESYQYDFLSTGDISGAMSGLPFRVGIVGGFAPEAVSAWSRPYEVTFPGANTKAYLEALQTALVVMVLSRPDLAVVDDLEDTKGTLVVQRAMDHKVLLPDVALLRTGLEGFEPLLLRVYPEYQETITAKGLSPVKFRKNLLQRVGQVARELRDVAGLSPDLERLVVERTQVLRTVTWGEILEPLQDYAAGGIRSAGFSNETILSSLQATSQRASAEEIALLQDEIRLLDVAGTGAASIAERRQALAAQISVLQEEGGAGMGKSTDFGIVQNPWSAGVAAKDMNSFAHIPEVIRFRKPHFIEVNPDTDGSLRVAEEIPASEVEGVLKEAGGLRPLYEKHVQEDGSIILPLEVVDYLGEIQERRVLMGSADLSPCLMLNASALREGAVMAVGIGTWAPEENEGAGFLLLRSVFGEFNGGQIYTESAFALGLLSKSLQPTDGEWIAMRFFDALPGLESFFESLQNWLNALQAAINSVADAILAYIDFILGKLVELQQLIRRINALIQSILGFLPYLPKFSGLFLTGEGTDGVLKGLLSAENKPIDSPLAYGAGLAVVVPLIPGNLAFKFLWELIRGTTGDPDGLAVVDTGTDLFGLEGIPDPGSPPGPNDEPDVL